MHLIPMEDARVDYLPSLMPCDNFTTTLVYIIILAITYFQIDENITYINIKKKLKIKYGRGLKLEKKIRPRSMVCGV